MKFFFVGMLYIIFKWLIKINKSRERSKAATRTCVQFSKVSFEYKCKCKCKLVGWGGWVEVKFMMKS